MNKLVDQFGTKYFPAHFTGDLERFLKTVTEIDVADARLCRDTMQVIITATHQGLYVQDSLDAERDAFFAENRRRQELQKQSPQTTALPIPTQLEDVLPTIRSLSPDKVYKLSNGSGEGAYAFACLVQAARPEIQFDLGVYAPAILSMVYKSLYPSDHQWMEFNVLRGPTFVRVSPRPGEYHALLRDNIAVPVEFGTKCLYPLPEWQRCLERISRILESSLSKKTRKIADYL